MEATHAEFNAQMENHTWVVVDRAQDANVLKCKWLWKLKESIDGLVRYKARLVVIGYMQKYGIDFDETFASVIRFETLRLVLLLAGLFGLEVRQIDFVTQFRNAKMHRSIYVEQPEGFIAKGQEHKVCLLLRSSYGLRQAHLEWNSVLHEFLEKLDFTRCYKDIYCISSGLTNLGLLLFQFTLIIC